MSEGTQTSVQDYKEGEIMITENYIKMCEKAPKELWDKQSKNSRIGTLMAWRSFLGIVKPNPEKRKIKGIAAFIPETLVIRTWLKDDEDITVLEVNRDYLGENPDEGTPLYSQEQLQEMVVNPILNVSEISMWALEAIENSDYYMNFNSWNELWLAFVMKRKYNKIWNGKEWTI